jgi:hypothetical protein
MAFPAGPPPGPPPGGPPPGPPGPGGPPGGAPQIDEPTLVEALRKLKAVAEGAGINWQSAVAKASGGGGAPSGPPPGPPPGP